MAYNKCTHKTKSTISHYTRAGLTHEAPVIYSYSHQKKIVSQKVSYKQNNTHSKILANLLVQTNVRPFTG